MLLLGYTHQMIKGLDSGRFLSRDTSAEVRASHRLFNPAPPEAPLLRQGSEFSTE